MLERTFKKGTHIYRHFLWPEGFGLTCLIPSLSKWLNLVQNLSFKNVPSSTPSSIPLLTGVNFKWILVISDFYLYSPLFVVHF